MAIQTNLWVAEGSSINKPIVASPVLKFPSISIFSIALLSTSRLDISPDIINSLFDIYLVYHFIEDDDAKLFEKSSSLLWIKEVYIK